MADDSAARASDSTVDELRRELEAERAKNAAMTAELRSLKSGHAQLQTTMEKEQEAMANKLMRNLEALKKQHDALAQQVAVEEDYIANTLQKKLEELRREKIDLENQLELEEEFIVNRLQKQLHSKIAQPACCASTEPHDESKRVSTEAHIAQLHARLSTLEKRCKDYRDQMAKMEDTIGSLRRENFQLVRSSRVSASSPVTIGAPALVLPCTPPSTPPRATLGFESMMLRPASMSELALSPRVLAAQAQAQQMPSPRRISDWNTTSPGTISPQHPQSPTISQQREQAAVSPSMMPHAGVLASVPHMMLTRARALSMPQSTRLRSPSAPAVPRHILIKSLKEGWVGLESPDGTKVTVFASLCDNGELSFWRSASKEGPRETFNMDAVEKLETPTGKDPLSLTLTSRKFSQTLVFETQQDMTEWAALIRDLMPRP